MSNPRAVKQEREMAELRAAHEKATRPQRAKTELETKKVESVEPDVAESKKAKPITPKPRSRKRKPEKE